MIMAISWHYTDVYGVIICYITEHLDTTNYLLNFGIIALHELSTQGNYKVHSEKY